MFDLLYLDDPSLSSFRIMFNVVSKKNDPQRLNLIELLKHSLDEKDLDVKVFVEYHYPPFTYIDLPNSPAVLYMDKWLIEHENVWSGLKKEHDNGHPDYF